MDLNEAASLLRISKERARIAIEEGIAVPSTNDRVRLQAVRLRHGYDVAQDDLDRFIAAFEEREPGRHPPVAIRRSLLIEAGYRCAVCHDSAPLEFHHMIEWSVLRHHDADQMLAVCANCHCKITRYGEPDISAQKSIKKTLREAQIARVAKVEVTDAAATVAPSARQDLTTTPAVAATSIEAAAVPFHDPDTNPPAPDPAIVETMRTIFAAEINYMGPSDDDLAWIAEELLAPVGASNVKKNCVLLLRTMRAIAQVQRITHPDAAWTSWVEVTRLTEATANVLVEANYDFDIVANYAEEALNGARGNKFLQFQMRDEWHPGMESGTGWVERASLSLVGSKVLKKTDAP